MVVRGMYRQEAMIALLSSSETTARQFLAAVARRSDAFGRTVERQTSNSKSFFLEVLIMAYYANQLQSRKLGRHSVPVGPLEPAS